MSSEHFQVSLVEIQTQWSLEDLVDAHLTLDMLEEGQAKGQPRGKPR